METKAVHYIADLWGVSFKILDDLSGCESIFIEAIEKTGCHILYKYGHKFQPQGLTLNFTLSESHCTIHTWPEHNYCAIDLYGCGNPENLELGIQHLIRELKPTKYQLKKINRGDPNE